MPKSILYVILCSFFITACFLFKKEKKKIILQNEDGYLELIATASHDTISDDTLEDLRFFVTLKNKYPIAVSSIRYLSFLECNVQRNGFHFHTVDSPFKRTPEFLKPAWFEQFQPDTIITITIFVDITKICGKKGFGDPAGLYTFQGLYYNDAGNEISDVPVWIGSVKSDPCSVIVK